MDLEQVFYALAALFGLAAVVYFAWEYVEVLPRVTKSALLFMLALALFLAAGALRTTAAQRKAGARKGTRGGA